jgi:hypothetical protein
MFPYYAISTTTEITSGAGVKLYTLLSTTSPYYIVATRMQQEKDLSETLITCGVNGIKSIVAHNYAKDYPLDLQMFYCNGNAVIEKTGTDEAFVSMTYIPQWAIPVATTTQSATTSTSTIPQYVNGFSYGDILISFFLFILVTNQFFGGILNRLMGRKQKANYKIRL